MAEARRRWIGWIVTALAVLLVVAWWLAKRGGTPPAAVDRPHPAASEPETTKPRAPRTRDDAAPAPAVAVETDAADPKASDVTSKESFALVVTVLRSDGNLAAGAEVRLTNPDEDATPLASAQADAHGVATMRAPSGLARIVAWLGADAAADAGLVDPSETHATTVRLEPAIVVHGRTVLGERPVAGAHVLFTLSPWLGSEFSLALEATSDAEGKFALTPVPTRGLAGAESRAIDAKTESLATGHAEIDTESLRRGDEVVVEMKPGFTVSARFVDAEGKPLAGVMIRVASQSYYAQSDVDGRCVLRLPGGVSLRLGAVRATKDVVPSEFDSDPVEEHWHVAKPLGAFDGASGDADLGDVALTHGLPVKGIVVDSTGQPARRARVSLSQDGISIGDVRTGDDGRFVFLEVGPEAHRVSAREHAAVARTAIVDGVHGGDPDLRIVLEDSFTIRFRFLSADDRKSLACAQFNIRAKHHGEGFDWFPFQNAGDPVESFDFDTISAGSFDVEIDVTGYEPLRFESVEVAANVPTPLDLLLRRKHE